MNTITPRLQLSTTLVYPSPLFARISGAANKGVPHRVCSESVHSDIGLRKDEYLKNRERVEHLGHTKVCHLDVEWKLAFYEHVLRLQVAMYHSLAVHVL